MLGVVTFTQGYPENEQVLALTPHIKMIHLVRKGDPTKPHHKPVSHVGALDAKGKQDKTTTEHSLSLSLSEFSSSIDPPIDMLRHATVIT